MTALDPSLELTSPELTSPELPSLLELISPELTLPEFTSLGLPSLRTSKVARSSTDAVADLQRRHGLPTTGALDARTERAWRRELAWRALEGEPHTSPTYATLSR